MIYIFLGLIVLFQIVIIISLISINRKTEQKFKFLGSYISALINSITDYSVIRNEKNNSDLSSELKNTFNSLEKKDLLPYADFIHLVFAEFAKDFGLSSSLKIISKHRGVFYNENIEDDYLNGGFNEKWRDFHDYLSNHLVSFFDKKELEKTQKLIKDKRSFKWYFTEFIRLFS